MSEVQQVTTEEKLAALASRLSELDGTKASVERLAKIELIVEPIKQLLRTTDGEPGKMAEVVASLASMQNQLHSLERLRDEFEKMKEAFDARLQDHADEGRRLQAEIDALRRGAS